MGQSDGKFGILGGFWAARPVAQQPGMRLSRWSIRKTRLVDGIEGLHFVGWNLQDQEGRVSSRILEFDAQMMRGRTDSGRVYELVGEPGFDADAEHVWECWCRFNKAQDIVDVTDEVMAQRGADEVP